ncbi:beta-alanyl-dopamine/carcinine hydrolase-like [Liolophura sinensis]|uniref:beta-alanyl-dopamine/carcinine hydrolase-like n=1 Tax=Liolophura sinensis TaxID=3198878 RepID=UPI0031590636
MQSSSERLPEALPVLFTKGTSYEVGFNIGKCFSERIRTYHERQGKFLSSMVQFYDSDEGRKHLQEYIDASENRFPNYMEEIKGTADGCGIAYEQILVSNFWRELYAHPSNSGYGKAAILEEPMGCTDILLNNDKAKVIGHNEDGELTMNDQDYIVCAEIDEYKTKDGRVFPAEKFVAHTYPGVLPGGCFAFNSHGLGYSVNTCWSITIPRNKIGEAIHMRHFLTARDTGDLLRILRDEDAGSTTGLGINAGFLHEQDLHSFEIAPYLDKPGNKVSMVTISNDNRSTSIDGPFYCRTNHPLHLPTEPMFSSNEGTVLRYERVRQISTRETRDDVLRILGDQQHPQFPVYRRGQTDKDTSNGTACTSLIDFNRKTLSVYKNNPRDAKAPVVNLAMTVFD